MGQFIGALLGTLMVSRLFLWLLKKMGDNVTRIFVADLATLGFAVFVGAYGFARVNEGPQFALAAEIYALPSLIWLVVDLVALRGRRVAKPVDATTDRPPTTH